MTALVLALDDHAAELALAGGKGASLAKLAAVGLPVPPGFHITTNVYREFVQRNSLQQRILAALGNGPEGASEQIAELFAAQEMPGDVAGEIRTAYEALRGPQVAVRSSATAEDLPDASFAGQQDTYLEIQGIDDVLDAVKRCWASLWTARAIAYRDRHEIAQDTVALAVVVQKMVPADAAGVMFTADPVTGDQSRIVVNAVRGLGEALVSGDANPQELVLSHDSLAITEERGESVLSKENAVELAELGLRIEKLYERPMDIEWAVHRDEIYIVQARPITVEAYEEWNDSLTGDFLWTSANLGEAIPSVMTPATWSLVKIFMDECMSLSALGTTNISGNIGGRFYLNLSLSMAVGKALGTEKMLRNASEQAFGRIPADVEIPPLPMKRFEILRSVVPTATRFLRKIADYQKRLPALLAEAPGRCADTLDRIGEARAASELLALWQSDVEPLLRETSRMLGAGARLDAGGLIRIRPWLMKLVSEEDANALMTGLHTSAGPLASMGPIIGLDQLRRGKMSREEYARKWGHRCPDEFEVSKPRPYEDPDWIDRELAGMSDSNTDVDGLLARQEKARASAMERFAARNPRKAKTLQKKMASAARGAHGREASRSEVIRAFGVLRSFILRCGDVTGHGEDLFFLSIDEIQALLGGDESPASLIAIRRNTFQRYEALPVYPTVVRGRFDPFRWAADPNRRADVYDETRELAPLGDAITGFAGATGVVEGVARVLTSMEQGDQLAAGEILVTTLTNVGWTPLFPRAAAVVTDVGAPLSHAAIVARELGIPAVVGTGNATARLKSGDRVRVDGGRGVVELLG